MSLTGWIILTVAAMVAVGFTESALIHYKKAWWVDSEGTPRSGGYADNRWVRTR